MNFSLKLNIFKNDHAESAIKSNAEGKWFESLSKAESQEDITIALRELLFIENNRSNELNHYAMLIAAEKGLFKEAQEFAEDLTRNGGTINTLNSSGETDLMIYARKGNDKVAEFLVKQLVENGEDIGLSNAEGVSALHLAAKSGSAAVVKVLLDAFSFNGRAVDCADNQGKTPLLLAVEHGFVKTAELLLDASQKCKANPRAIQYTEHMAFRRAMEKGNLALVKAMVEILPKAKGELFLIDHKGSNALTLAAANGDLPTLEFCLTQLSQIEQKICLEDVYLHAALESAAENGQAHLVQPLLERLANSQPSLSEAESEMRKFDALELAVENGHVEAAKVLIDNFYSSAKKIDQPEKNALLVLAASKKHWQIAGYLFDEYKKEFGQAHDKNDLSRTLTEILYVAATNGNFDEHVADFAKNVLIFFKDISKNDLVEKFKPLALQAIKCSSVNVLKVLLAEIVQKSKSNDVFESIRFNNENLLFKTISYNNKHVLKIFIEALTERGIYFNEFDFKKMVTAKSYAASHGASGVRKMIDDYL